MSDPIQSVHPETLHVHRSIPASPDRVFAAWTTPDEMEKWWGPEGVTCKCVEVDLRVGGRYRIANEMPDGSVVWISGYFEVIERPHRLVYSWTVEINSPTEERVEVKFEPSEVGTDLTITHARIATRALSEQHLHGWEGCLDGLLDYLAEQRPTKGVRFILLK